MVDDAVAERSFFRTILMHGFHMLVYVMCVRGIRDTQVRLGWEAVADRIMHTYIHTYIHSTVRV